MRKMMQLKRRAALVLSAAMVVSAPSLQTFAKQLNTDVSSTAKANDVRVATSGDADPATGGDAKPAAKENVLAAQSALDQWDGPWKAIAFGQSTDLNFSSNVLEDKVGTNYVWPLNSDQPLPSEEEAPVQDVIIESRGGKIQTGHDGLTFYYTEVPTDKNFKLSADVTIEHMGPENGKAPNAQEGAGLMVRDVNGAARKDPLEEGYEEYPAASNMVMLEVLPASKAVNAALNIKAMARYGVNSPAGNLNTPTPSNVFVKNAASADNSMAPADAPYPEANFYNAKMKLTLERTDQGYTETYTGPDGTEKVYTFTDKNVTSNIVAHLDQEIMRVGFFASRNARMKVENIEMYVSDVENPDTTPAYVAPNTEKAELVSASSSYTNSSSYTLQALVSLDGVITVSQDGTKLIDSQPVAGGSQFAYPTQIEGDSSQFVVEYVADEGSEAGKVKSATITVKKETYGNDLYVSPDGTPEAPGTKESPMDISTALTKVVPGGTVYMLEGQYEPFQVPMSAAGNEEARKSLVAVGNVVVTGGSSQLFVLDSDYWYVKGLDVDGKDVAGSRGFMIHGSHNIVESCLIHNTSSDAGLTITKKRGSRSLWPSYNKVIHCESYENRDASGINADGFASKSQSGDDNVFENCVSHDNADDGWDLYNTLAAGPNGRTIIKNCVAYNNGNNGFKLGGEGREVPHELINSVAYNNGLDGITDNFNSGELLIRNNTSYDNKRFNIILRPSPYKTDENGELTADGIVENNVSYRSDEYSLTLDKIYDDKVASRVNENNFFYIEQENSVSEEDFVTLDKDQCFRWEEGTILFGDFLKPAIGSVIREANAGAYLSETDEPDEPDTPDNPDEPDTPDKPDTPDNPDEPDTPDKPDTPDNPDEPDTPDKPDLPDTPDKPDDSWIIVPVPELNRDDLSPAQKEEAERQIAQQTDEIEKALNEAAGNKEFVKDRIQNLENVLKEQNLPATVELKQTIDEVQSEAVVTVADDGTVTTVVLIKKLVYDIGLYDTESGKRVELSDNFTVIRFPVVLPAKGIDPTAKYVKTTHKDDVAYSDIAKDDDVTYTVIATRSFSPFVLEFTASKPSMWPSRGGSSSGSSKTAVSQWIQNSTGWWFKNADGTWPANCWSQLTWNGTYQWYRFNADGYMMTGWYLDTDGNRYFLHNISDGSQGYMYTGWHLIDGKWYYFRENAGGPMGSLLVSGTTPDGYRTDGEGACQNYPGR